MTGCCFVLQTTVSTSAGQLKFCSLSELSFLKDHYRISSFGVFWIPKLSFALKDISKLFSLKSFYFQHLYFCIKKIQLTCGLIF